jgi:prevent-host-death family protein
VEPHLLVSYVIHGHLTWSPDLLRFDMKAKQMQISTFKATCIEALRDVERTSQPLVITVRGKPIAVVGPPPRQRTLGALAGQCEILVDLLKTDFAAEWEMNR